MIYNFNRIFFWVANHN